MVVTVAASASSMLDSDRRHRQEEEANFEGIDNQMHAEEMLARGNSPSAGHRHMTTIHHNGRGDGPTFTASSSLGHVGHSDIQKKGAQGTLVFAGVKHPLQLHTIASMFSDGTECAIADACRCSVR